MYKIASLGLLGLLVVLVIPANSEDSASTSLLYGGVTMVLQDENGQEKFSQTIHNQLWDEGEDFIVTQVFTDNTTGAITDDTIQIGAICLSRGTVPTTESDVLSTVISADTSTTTNRCKTDTSVGAVSGLVTIAETFTTGVNWTSGETISGISICAADTSDAAQNDCTTLVFAIVDTSDVTPTGSETVTITYTFDISNDSK